MVVVTTLVTPLFLRATFKFGPPSEEPRDEAREVSAQAAGGS